MSKQDIALAEKNARTDFDKATKRIIENSAQKDAIQAAFMQVFQKMPLADQKYFVDWCIGYMEANQ